MDLPPTPWTAEPFVPSTVSLKKLSDTVDACRGCPLHAMSDHAVFGAGTRHAALVLVGEQPGDVEDRQDAPFVGPAGRVLWRCVESAGLDRSAIYATNAVKHFKHQLRGKRRIHQRPTAEEIDACHPWLSAELKAVRGRVVVALGASAARSLLGRPTPIAANRRTRFTVDGHQVAVTYHPSAVLRADERAAEIEAALVDDLRLAASWLDPM